MPLHRSFTLSTALLVSLLVCPTPVAAQQAPGLSPPAARTLVVPEFADREVADLLAGLDSALVGRQPAASADDVGHILWAFVRRLQAGRLPPSQEASVLDHLLSVGSAHANYRDPIEQARYMVRALTVGKTAPEATGQDLRGNAFSLSDYRGKVVVLTFSADWCAICRTQYPYYRLMEELYANWPFAILGVEAGTREAVSRLKAQHRLTYRSWWDGAGAESVPGPIATAWHVRGWPTTYVLDAQGTVRFVNLRDEDLLKGVRQLLAAQADLAAETAPRHRH